jgi:hypothetical protein
VSLASQRFAVGLLLGSPNQREATLLSLKEIRPKHSRITVASSLRNKTMGYFTIFRGGTVQYTKETNKWLIIVQQV